MRHGRQVAEQCLEHGKHSVNVWLPVIWNSSLSLEDSLRMSPGRTESTLKAERPAAASLSPLGPRAWAWLIGCPSLSVMSPCLPGSGHGGYAELGSSKNSLFPSSSGNRTSHSVLTTSSLWWDLAVVLCGLLVSAHFRHLVLQASQKFCVQFPPQINSFAA